MNNPQKQPQSAHSNLLVRHGSRNGVAVVAAKKESRRGERRRKVESRVEIRGRSTAITKEGNRHVGFSHHFEAVGSSDGLRQLRAERTGNRVIVERAGTVVNGHLTSLAKITVVGKALVGKLLERKAAPHE